SIRPLAWQPLLVGRGDSSSKSTSSPFFPQSRSTSRSRERLARSFRISYRTSPVGERGRLADPTSGLREVPQPARIRLEREASDHRADGLANRTLPVGPETRVLAPLVRERNPARAVHDRAMTLVVERARDVLRRATLRAVARYEEEHPRQSRTKLR